MSAPKAADRGIRASTRASRGLCLRCLRAESVCLCAELRPFPASFTIAILQHPRERRNSIGSARLAHLCVENSLLIPGIAFDEEPKTRELLDDPTRRCVVLYPGESATDVSAHGPAYVDGVEREGRRLTVFVIDGTWSQAKGMLRRSPRLAALPRISFPLEGRSGYRVRRQPRPECLSTLEAVHRLLRILEPAKPADALVELFARMVDRQAECALRGDLRENATAV
jgi:DTW domain-containing protein YfiP